MLLLGIDLGTSSIKVSVVDADSQQCIASAQYPDKETEIIAVHPGWAEQDPDQWWEHIQQAILRVNATRKFNPKDIKAIGIAYQMHGLVIIDDQEKGLRNSIIWCDSRAVEIGNRAFEKIGEERCLSHLLNSPGNFTASKLAWVKKNEPKIYERVSKAMLPGDFIAMRMTGEIGTTVSALSEGVFWDFRNNELSKDVLSHFGFDERIIPPIRKLFSIHGSLRNDVASKLSLTPGIPVSYKSGDQPNNALSLNVLEPGEVAATAGTSGVIYGVSEEMSYDPQSRINSFAHVNHDPEANHSRIGILLCINGVGIFNRWIRSIAGQGKSYAELNEAAASTMAGSEGLLALPFGNGAERMLNNQLLGGKFAGLDFNTHSLGHLVRSIQEGIAFSFRYGLDIMRENGIRPSVVRAGRSNLFLSEVFTRAFATINQVAVEFYEGDGSIGAAIGAGIGAGIYKDPRQANRRKPIGIIEPGRADVYPEIYSQWKALLNSELARKKADQSTI